MFIIDLSDFFFFWSVHHQLQWIKKCSKNCTQKHYNL